jgi:hypothetical protein
VGRSSVLLLSLGVALVASASGCGAGETVGGGDCSGATPDGNGGCIAPYHGPDAAQRAAKRHFNVDTVECFNHGPVTFKGRKIHAWGCKAIKEGTLQDDLYCVFLENGAALTRSEIAALPKSKRSCL